MADNLRSMTVKELKELAKVRIGAGYSKLRTKAALIEALEKVTSSAPASSPAPVSSPASPQVSRKKNSRTQAPLPLSQAAVSQAEIQASAAQRPAVIPKPETLQKAVPPAPASPAAAPSSDQTAAAPESAAEPTKERQEDGAPPVSAGQSILSQAGRDLVQAFGKARSQCSDPFFLNDAMEGILPEDEALGELPESYGEESLVLISKGPYALYLYWDFSGATLERLAAMDGAVTCLRLFAGEQMIRELECTLHDRSWYFHGLQPGLRYRVELVAVDKNGRSERIGPSSNSVTLPPGTPSPLIDDRFVRLPFDASSMSIAEAIAAPETKVAASREQRQFSMTLRTLIYQASGGRLPSPSGSSEQWPLPPDASSEEDGSLEDEERRSNSSLMTCLFSGPKKDDP